MSGAPRTEVGTDGLLEMALEPGPPPASARRSALAEALAGTVQHIVGQREARVVLLTIGPSREDDGSQVPLIRALAEAECRAEQAAVERLATLSIPVVARLRGLVRGPLFEVALACNARIADPAARVGIGELDLGLPPRLGGLRRVVQRAGLEAAIELGVRGAVLDAERARALGLIDGIPGPDDVRSTALALGRRGPNEPPRPTSRRDRDALARLRSELASRHDVGYPAQLAAAELLEAGLDGRDASSLGARHYGELVFSTAARQLQSLRRAARSLGASAHREGAATALLARLVGLGLGYAPSAAAAVRDQAPFVERIFSALHREARALVDDGVDADRIRGALMDWGFLNELEDLRRAKAGARMPRELIQMRCVLPLVVEALRALDSGEVPSPAHGDVASVFLGGFPPFRGGVFQYVEEVGADELAARLRVFAREHGTRYEPPPWLNRRVGETERTHLSR